MPSPKQFRKEREIQSDKLETIFPLANIQVINIALDVAGIDVEFPAIGDFLFVDRLSTGVATIKFNNTAMPGFPVAKNAFLLITDLKKIHVSWAAQAGMVLNIWYGRGVEFIDAA